MKYVFDSKGKENQEHIRNEIALMLRCKHTNIVSYDEAFIYKEKYWIFMEYLEAGCLTEVIDDLKAKVNERFIQYVIHETLQALLYLHSKHIIHRDIKSDNILLGSNGRVKLADFGYAAQLTQERRNRNSKVGTVCWMAPEVIRGKDYSATADVWSLGVMLLELIFGKPPYLNLPQAKVITLILTNSPPEIPRALWSNDLRDFAGKCMQKEPEKRASV